VGVAPIGALFVVPAGGGSPRPVAPDFAHARYGTWSPHGEKILFVGARQHDPSGLSLDWFVVGVSGGEPVATGALRVLRQAGVHGVPIPAAWSADGTVVFANNDDGASNVWQLAISPETGLAAGAPVRLTFGTAVERSPAISASGRVAFTSLVENVDIWRLPLDAETGLVGGAMERVTDNAATDVLMNVSDDGRTMAFMSSRTGQREVWITDLSTGRDRQLTLPGARSAHVSRDGSRLAIDRASETRGIDLVPTTGGASTPLCDGCATGDWSPDGRHMVVHRGLPSRLLMRDLESGRETELAAHPTWNLFRPRFSPDGRWIVFHTTNSPSLRQVYAVPAFQDAAVPLEAWIPIVPDFGVHPNWAPDGAGIYHFSIRDGLFCVWLQPLDLSTKRPVGKAQAVEHFHKAGLRAATGAGVTNHVAAGYLYVTLTSAAANIWMLER
jgi:Tol biopolymer transport system component